MSARKPHKSKTAAPTRPVGQALPQTSIQIQSLPPRNPVAKAMALRAASGAAGRHMPSGAAQRRADTVSLQKQLRMLDNNKKFED
jgi:hypothetical protein